MPKKLQIIIMGWEWDRIFQGVRQRLPNKVVFVCPKKEEIDIGEKTNILCSKIANKVKVLVESEIYYTDYGDYVDCLETLNKIILKYKKDYVEIEINISAGGKLILYTAILVAQYNNCNLFYGIPEKYNIPKGKFLTEGIKEWIDIPIFNLRDSLQVSKFEFKILTTTKNKISLTKLAEKLNENLKDIYDGRKYKMQLLYHIKKLEAKKLVRSDIQNGEKIITLTQTGDFLIKTCNNF